LALPDDDIQFFQGPTPTHPTLDEPKSEFISSLLAQRIGRHPAHSQCDDLTSKIEGNEKMVRKLRKVLRKIHKAEGGAGSGSGSGSGSEGDDDDKVSLKSLVRGALKVVQEMILGGFSSAHHPEQSQPDHSNPTKLDKMMRKVQDRFGVDSLDQLEIKLAHMARHLEHMKDQAGVICTAPEYVDDQIIHAMKQTEGYEGGMIYHGPDKALAKLLHHLSPTPHLLPSEEALEEMIKWDEEKVKFSGDSQEYTLTGVPGLEQGGATGEVIARTAYHQVNTPDGKGMDLRMVWRFVVEMKENWYEASVDVEDLRVVGVVDWGEWRVASQRRDRGAVRTSSEEKLIVVFPCVRSLGRSSSSQETIEQGWETEASSRTSQVRAVYLHVSRDHAKIYSVKPPADPP
jgi:hypothetical protein